MALIEGANIDRLRELSELYFKGEDFDAVKLWCQLGEALGVDYLKQLMIANETGQFSTSLFMVPLNNPDALITALEIFIENERYESIIMKSFKEIKESRLGKILFESVEK